MAEIERNPLAVRQGAAAVACIAAAAVAMPVISHRAAEQREGDWAARGAVHQVAPAQAAYEPDARIELTAYRTSDGLKMRGSASLFADTDTHAMLVEAALRGPLAPNANVATTPVQPQQAIDARSLNCLSQAVYYEARGESFEGQIAVAEVVMNRLHSKLYPKSVCEVVYQGSDRSIGCQFTFTCDGSVDRRPRGAAWARAQQVAGQVLGGFARPMIGHATHYHTFAVDPIWSSGMIETTRIGSHIFYRFPYESERPQALQALAERRHGGANNSADDSDDTDDATPPAQLLPQAPQAAQAEAVAGHQAQKPAQTPATPATAPNSEVST